MTWLTPNKPDCFNFLPDSAFFFEVVGKKGIHAHFGVELSPPVAHIHLVLGRASKDSLVAAKKDGFPHVVTFCKEMGCSRLVASKGGENEDLDKFKRLIAHFGFNDPQKAYIAIQEV